MDNYSSKLYHKYQLQTTQKQVDEIIIIMQDNLNKVIILIILLFIILYPLTA